MFAELHQALLDCDSATVVLERFFGGPIHIRRIDMAPVPPAPAQAARLALGPGTAWAHRRVELLAGGEILSEADIWFVPSRLLPGMVRALAETDTPFGRVVAPLRPRRRSIAAEWLEGESGYALVHRALLVTDDGPIAEVDERYKARLKSIERVG